MEEATSGQIRLRRRPPILRILGLGISDLPRRISEAGHLRAHELFSLRGERALDRTRGLSLGRSSSLVALHTYPCNSKTKIVYVQLNSRLCVPSGRQLRLVNNKR